jgi:hypothetical protein
MMRESPLFCAQVLAAGHHVHRDLAPLELGRRQHVAGADVQHIVAGEALVGAVFSVVERGDDGQAAVFAPDVALLVDAAQQALFLDTLSLMSLPCLR